MELGAAVADGKTCKVEGGAVLGLFKAPISDVDPDGSLPDCSGSTLGTVERVADSSGFESLQPVSDSVTSESESEHMSENSRAKLFMACQNGL